uniref:tryptophan--tRNA ligase n=1 Tax=Nicotiana tabacum TaxID=4097 RepID=A0A1S4DJW3_TOBAC|nr:PREDICTED: tryptophan--tRNA ligase, cytoplasmic-like [Nicotiana tabacum]
MDIIQIDYSMLNNLSRQSRINDPLNCNYVQINRYAFSGGQDSIELHRKYGANLEVDIPFKYLGFFLDDDAELERIREEYGSGRMLTCEVKKRLTEVLTDLVERHRRARALVTDEVTNTNFWCNLK